MTFIFSQHVKAVIPRLLASSITFEKSAIDPESSPLGRFVFPPVCFQELLFAQGSADPLICVQCKFLFILLEIQWDSKIQELASFISSGNFTAIIRSNIAVPHSYFCLNLIKTVLHLLTVFFKLFLLTPFSCVF